MRYKIQDISKKLMRTAVSLSCNPKFEILFQQKGSAHTDRAFSIHSIHSTTNSMDENSAKVPGRASMVIYTGPL